MDEHGREPGATPGGGYDVLRVHLFGRLLVLDGTRELTARSFSGVKPKQLFELLVLERGHSVSKERLANAVWGEQLPRNYMATLETYVSVLRRSLLPGARARDSVVLTDHGGYRVDESQLDVDLDAFDALLARAATAAPLEALTTLQSALTLVRGTVLEDEPYAEWANAVRETYLQRRVQALIDAARLSLLSGDGTGAVQLAEQAVALNPLAEPAYQVLMTAAYSMWRQEDALQAFDRCRRLLGAELGVDPMDETVALHLAILRHEDVASLLAGLQPAGQRVTISADTSSLPLLARETELAQLVGALDRARGGRLQLVLVTGDLGVGKTRLVQTFLDRHVDLPVGSNRCSDLERELPYLALSLALRPILADTGSSGLPVLDELLERIGPAEAFDRFARLRAMESLATSVTERAPFVLWLDDVQWADDETLRTLNFLQRRCERAGLLVLLTCERAALSRDPLRTLQPDLRVDLGLLPEESLRDLGHDELFAVTGGHPLFVDGWLKARARGLLEPFPPELRELVITTCWDLGPQAYRLLTVLAALEGPVPPTLLSRLLGIQDGEVAEELDRLASAGYLTATPSEVAFRLPAVRVVLAETMSPARAYLLRQQAAAALTSGSPRRRATDASEDAPGRRVIDLEQRAPSRPADRGPAGLERGPRV